MLELVYETQDERKYVVYEKKDTDQVDGVVLGMLLNNKIPGCLPFLQRQIDAGISYCYEITGLQTLGEYFKGVVNKKKLLKTVEKILDISSGLEEYMMDISATILDDSSIYVSPENGEIYMLILPIVHHEPALEMFLRHLIFSIQYDTQEDCSYIASLLSFFNGGQEFSTVAFKKLLQELKSEAIHTKETVRQTDIQKSEFISGNRTIPRENIPRWENQAVNIKQTGNSNVSGAMYPSQPIPRVGNPVERNKKTDLYPQRDNEIVSGNQVPGSNVMPQLSQPVVQEKRGLFGKRKKVEKTEKKQEKVPTSFHGIAIPGAEEKNEQYDINKINGEKYQNVIPVQNVEIKSHRVPQQNFGETMDLRTYAQETSVLNVSQMDKIPQPQMYLERKKTGVKFIISKEETKIGRSKEQVDFFITDNSSIGRIHAILYKEGNRIFVEDNASKNGTFLNGKKITNREEVQPDNVLTLSDEEFVLRIQ